MHAPLYVVHIRACTQRERERQSERAEQQEPCVVHTCAHVYRYIYTSYIEGEATGRRRLSNAPIKKTRERERERERERTSPSLWSRSLSLRVQHTREGERKRDDVQRERSEVPRMVLGVSSAPAVAGFRQVPQALQHRCSSSRRRRGERQRKEGAGEESGDLGARLPDASRHSSDSSPRPRVDGDGSALLVGIHTL